jgi:hypothetical protein
MKNFEKRENFYKNYKIYNNVQHDEKSGVKKEPKNDVF